MKSLITGVPGSGKSTLTAELNLRPEVIAYDADQSIGRWENANWEMIPAPESVNAEALRDTFYNWHRASLLRLISDRQEDVIILGASRNQDSFYEYFDQLFLLRIDERSLADRLKARTEGFGHTAPSVFGLKIPEIIIPEVNLPPEITFGGAT
jgi:broad-specificity NMP kinase